MMITSREIGGIAVNDTAHVVGSNGIQMVERRFGDSVIMLRKNARTRSTLGSVIDGVTPCPEFVLERPDNTAPQERDLF